MPPATSGRYARRSSAVHSTSIFVGSASASSKNVSGLDGRTLETADATLDAALVTADSTGFSSDDEPGVAPSRPDHSPAALTTNRALPAVSVREQIKSQRLRRVIFVGSFLRRKTHMRPG